MISYLGILCSGLTCSEFHFWKITLAVVWRMDWKVRKMGLKKITLWATGVESELGNNSRDGQGWEDARYIENSEKKPQYQIGYDGKESWMIWSFVLIELVDLLMWEPKCWERFLWDSYIHVLGYIEFDTSDVRHQERGLEGKWDVDNQSKDRSSLKM